ncbi:hypothetical protein RYX36_031266, partial [Vicia faba]
STKRMCSSIEGCSVPSYEFIFTRLSIRFTFSNFEVVVQNRLRVSPSQLYPGAWTFMKPASLGMMLGISG